MKQKKGELKRESGWEKEVGERRNGREIETFRRWSSREKEQKQLRGRKRKIWRMKTKKLNSKLQQHRKQFTVIHS